MQAATTVAKTPINIRLNSDLLELLEKVSATEETLYWQRDRTWLIEHAIEKTFSEFKNGNSKEKEASGRRPPQ